MHPPHLRRPVVTVLAWTSQVLALLIAPLPHAVAWATTGAKRIREEDGVSDVVGGLLMAGGIALIVIIVLGIIQPWAENEASNLPSSGG
ncbi:hypothetical protein [Nitriliruptor alkaliphilus]|uniref:hypothetical protein n=1 Tax=Nitriliruptor alkaliphilus TaxID=427918 RepID=UPI0012EDC298|nr:hypothetical protein [Nitriliruptor alkaliphilus]